MRRILVSLVMALVAACGGSGAPAISVEQAWARPTLTAAQSGAVYLKISNSGQAGDLLQEVSSTRGRASLHNSIMDDGIVRMRPLTGGIAIAAGSSVELKPNGMHIMLEGLGEPLKAGASIPLTLRFKSSGDRQVQVQIAGSPATGHGHGH